MATALTSARRRLSTEIFAYLKTIPKPSHTLAVSWMASLPLIHFGFIGAAIRDHPANLRN
jgi:hypothetical protein